MRPLGSYMAKEIQTETIPGDVLLIRKAAVPW